ncbi:centromere protein X isoform X8 [Callithrix jacchus]|uniref:centromere protein X isoform X2 n=1 Tax=Callithrix jacchus TaxID=9483 RepID=UPI00159D9F04|nr:centromere protein X isoform X2 [Callithrix jacchus]
MLAPFPALVGWCLPWVTSLSLVAPPATQGCPPSLSHCCSCRLPLPVDSSWELVSRLLHAHFKDDKTKVSGDSLQLMAELLKIFVVGEPRAQAPSQKQPSVRYGRPRQKMPFLWMWTSWRRCFRSCSWTSRDLSRG